MKTCKSFFHKSLIITSAAELKLMEPRKLTLSYGFCLIACINHDYKTQIIHRFTESFDLAYAWLIENESRNCCDTYGVVLGGDL